MAEASRELSLYVQSKRAISTFYRPPTTEGNVAGARATSASAVTGEGSTDTRGEEGLYFLSDDQARCVALTEEVASRRGYHVKVVDIEKVGRVERLIAEHLRNVQTFPVLTSPRGPRLEGVEMFTEERLSELMPTELRHQRAFSYIKVKGGDLDRIRNLLETFSEVKELHLLTGDWDVLAVLDFPSSANKRAVLDFVTDRIRGIPEVLDTSTVVPEFSVTKFPIE
ncbi:MAG: Lrp/AsnC ligand binding domain-containing protein [Thermoplasmata archaeon]